MTKHYVFDIDGTLSIAGSRLRHILTEPKDWESFYERCDEDEPNEPVFDILWALYGLPPNPGIYYVTGRRENTRKKTIDWLLDQGVLVDADHLLMRPNGDHRPDTEVKPELLKKAGIVPHVIFEDRNSMVKKWRELGYTCFQVAEGDF